MKTEIIVRLQVEGVHSWPSCNLEEVAYLKDEHRHIFHIEARAPVLHDDRQVEFIQLKHQISDRIVSNFFEESKYLCDFKNMSCEMIAKFVLGYFPDLSECSVFEDGENGARVVR